MADGTQPVPYAVQRGIMQGIVDQEVALSTHRDESQECVDANKLCVWRENEIWWCILTLSPPCAVKVLAHFCLVHNKDPLSDPSPSMYCTIKCLSSIPAPVNSS